MTQELRFTVLAELFQYEPDHQFSLHEIGCGLAHFKHFLDKKGITCNYSGSDILRKFLDICKKKYPDSEFILQDISEDLDKIKPPVRDKDYYIVSGTFNPKGKTNKKIWETFIFKTMANMFALCRKGIACNFLTAYSDFYDKELYYADPKLIYDWCVQNLSRFVNIRSDYPLYEFTIFIYKKEFIHSVYPQGFEKYFK